MLMLSLSAATAAAAPLSGLRTVVVGAGPAGLLLSHRLLDAGASVELLEGRPDPRTPGYLEGRAYALGLGLRGRTAIRTVDESLWQAVAAKGFPSDRFTLHLGPFKVDLRTPDDSNSEPSILLYQSDLCAALLEELNQRHGARFSASFQSKVVSCDPVEGVVKFLGADGAELEAKADLVAGADGVRSVVRDGIAAASPGFQASIQPLPGNLKVVRLDAMPPGLNPDAVSVVPGSPISAFVEPTASGACALLTWPDTVGGGDGPDGAAAKSPGELTDADEAARLLGAIPLIGSQLNNSEVGGQFVRQGLSRAATVKCNSYHLGRAALLGDAAHSTGGASGQGCNSALQDAAALADLLEAEAEAEATAEAAAAAAAAAAATEGGGGGMEAVVQRSLLAYSRQRVPEGHALLELSTGSSSGRNASPVQRVLNTLSTVANTILNRFGRGEPPIQTELTTSLAPFADIRRRRDAAYGEAFSSDEDFEREIARVVVGQCARGAEGLR
jgi:kynurenine 3-monooxygenase